MIRAITFDLDQTLIDFVSYKKKCASAAIHAMVKAGFKGNRLKLEKELMDFYFSYGIESHDIFTAFLKMKGSYTDRILAAGINAYRSHRVLKPYPGVKKTLLKLKKKGYKLGVVTDAPRLKAYLRLDSMGIASLFDVVVGKEDTGRVKPSTLPFKKALSLLGVKPSEAMHVGDYPEKDVLGAKKAGMKTCFARYGDQKQGRKVWADYYVDRVEDVWDVVEKGLNME